MTSYSPPAVRYTGWLRGEVTRPLVVAFKHPAQESKCSGINFAVNKSCAGPALAGPLSHDGPAAQVNRILDSKATKKVVRKITYHRDNTYLRAATGAEMPATLRAKNKWHMFHTRVYRTPQGSISAYKAREFHIDKFPRNGLHFSESGKTTIDRRRWPYCPWGYKPRWEDKNHTILFFSTCSVKFHLSWEGRV